MKPSDLATTLKDLIPTRRPVYIWGPPGCSKSSVVKQTAGDLELELLDLRAVLLDPVDLRGVPCIKRGVAEWCPPSFWPLKGRVKRPGLIFADELAQAPPLVQAAFLQGILDHRIGEVELDPSWSWVAASNRQEDRAGAHRLISPLLNRFIHLDLEVNNDDWQAWAANEGIAPEVRAFLRFKPALLFSFDAQSAGLRAFPTPRSWSFVSDVLPKVSSSALRSVVAGCVGDAPAAEFLSFCQIYHDLPDMEKVLANPETSAIPREPSVLYAMVEALSEKLRTTTDSSLFARASMYLVRLPTEFAVLALKLSTALGGELLKQPAVQDFMFRHRDLMVA